MEKNVIPEENKSKVYHELKTAIRWYILGLEL